MKKEKIEDALLKMGIPANIKGFAYITQAILLLDKEEWRYPKFTEIYKEIAKISKISSTNVERAIRIALEHASRAKSNDGYQVAHRYIGMINTTNSASLSQLYLMLKREEENEKNNA